MHTGSFGEAAVHTDLYVEWLRQYCEAFYYGLVVKILPPVTVQSTGCTFRVNSHTYNLQLYAGEHLVSVTYVYDTYADFVVYLFILSSVIYFCFIMLLVPQGMSEAAGILSVSQTRENIL